MRVMDKNDRKVKNALLAFAYHVGVKHASVTVQEALQKVSSTPLQTYNGVTINIRDVLRYIAKRGNKNIAKSRKKVHEDFIAFQSDKN